MRIASKHVRVSLCAWLCIPPALGILLVWQAISRWWNPPAPGIDPFFDSVGRPVEPFYTQNELHGQLAGAMAVAVVLAAAPLLAFVVNAARDQSRGSMWRVVSRWSMVVAAFAPVICRLVLPIEDPYTGAGSPLAVALNVAFFGGVFAVIFALPAAILALSGRSRGTTEHSGMDLHET